MRNLILCLSLPLLSLMGFGQVDSLKTISLDIEIMVHDQEKVKVELNSFLVSSKVVPELYNEFNNQFVSHFVLSQSTYFEFVKAVEKWGAVRSRKVTSVNYSEKLEAVNQEIERLEKEKKEYNELLSKVDIKTDNHVKYWEKLEETKTSLRKQFALKENYIGSNKKFHVKLRVKEENYLSNEPDFSFVNMPGVQYSYFMPANTADGKFPESMTGYSIKYLMNRRKTYLELGLFKANEDNELNQYDELYKFGMGQDFYSSHLGRGTRNFLNLYSGFNVGVYILTGKQDKQVSWFATPSLGLEIYKNKFILLDTKAGYLLPFKDNRNMRGWLFEASLNIVF